MPRPLIATIDIAAMRHNLAVAQAAAPQARTWAVIKANAYGHGLARALRGFAAADGMALIETEAAVHLRELGWSKPVLLLEGFFDAADIQTILNHGLQTAVHCEEQIAILAQAQLSVARPIEIHLKMNSGMNRLGFAPADFAAAHARLRAMPGIGKITLMTHFANADVLQGAAVPVAEQLRRFNAVAGPLGQAQSLCNSAAVLHYPELAQDWIRPGIMLYGATPGVQSAAESGLRPAMTLRSELIGVQQVAAGESVGYGSRFTLAAPGRIGVVACGYADGYPRHAPTGTPIVVDGVRTRLVGRVSMDMITVDLTPVPAARVGSKVVLWGEGLPVDEVAEAAGTIGYELLCAVAPRVRMLEC